MPRTADQLAAEVRALPPADQARVLALVIAGLDDAGLDDAGEAEDPAEVEAAWLAEVDRRERALDADPSLSQPAAEVFAAVRRDLEDQRGDRRRRRG
ncbi:MAG: hypothetical protein WKG32_20215 [Gemmatimonadaceae bacterium]